MSTTVVGAQKKVRDSLRDISSEITGIEETIDDLRFTSRYTTNIKLVERAISEFDRGLEHLENACEKFFKNVDEVNSSVKDSEVLAVKKGKEYPDLYSLEGYFNNDGEIMTNFKELSLEDYEDYLKEETKKGEALDPNAPGWEDSDLSKDEIIDEIQRVKKDLNLAITKKKQQEKDFAKYVEKWGTYSPDGKELLSHYNYIRGKALPNLSDLLTAYIGDSDISLDDFEELSRKEYEDYLKEETKKNRALDPDAPAWEDLGISKEQISKEIKTVKEGINLAITKKKEQEKDYQEYVTKWGTYSPDGDELPDM